MFVVDPPKGMHVPYVTCCFKNKWLFFITACHRPLSVNTMMPLCECYKRLGDERHRMGIHQLCLVLTAAERFVLRHCRNWNSCRLDLNSVFRNPNLNQVFWDEILLHWPSHCSLIIFTITSPWGSREGFTHPKIESVTCTRGPFTISPMIVCHRT